MTEPTDEQQAQAADGYEKLTLAQSTEDAGTESKPSGPVDPGTDGGFAVGVDVQAKRVLIKFMPPIDDIRAAQAPPVLLPDGSPFMAPGD
jgi:hypothetical protein